MSEKPKSSGRSDNAGKDREEWMGILLLNINEQLYLIVILTKRYDAFSYRLQTKLKA